MLSVLQFRRLLSVAAHLCTCRVWRLALCSGGRCCARSAVLARHVEALVDVVVDEELRFRLTEGTDITDLILRLLLICISKRFEDF